MKRVAKKVGKVVAWIMGVVVALLLVVLAEPGWLLNKKTLVWAIGKFGAAYRPEWKSLEFEIRNVSLITKRVVFKADDFRVDETHGALKAAFPVVDLDATIHFGVSPLVSVRRLERLVLRSDAVAVDQTKQPETARPRKRKSSSGSLQLVPAPLRRMTVGLVDVKIPSAVVKTATGTTTAKVSADFTERGETPLEAAAYVVTTGTSPTTAQHYKADLSLATDLWRRGRLSYLDLKAALRGDGGLSADLKALVEPAKDGRLRLTAGALARAAGKALKAELTGDYSADEAKAAATLAVEDPKGSVRRAALEDCRFDAPLRKGQPKKADLKCRIAVVPGAFALTENGKPKQLTGELKLHADFKRLRAAKDRFTAQLDAELGPQGRSSDFLARLSMELAGRTGDVPASLAAKHKLELSMTVKRFQDLVEYFKSTEFAIPAPVNAFQGPVKLTMSTAGNSRGEDQRVVYKATTDLTSPHKEALKTRIEGHVDIKGLFLAKKTIVDRTEVDLEDVALQLPNMSIKDAAKTPSPAVDTRIKTGDPKRDQAAEAKRKALTESERPAKQKSNVDYDAHVFTSKPVRILTNLVKTPIPIALDLHAKPDGLSGKIAIQPFDLEIFRQTGHIDHITLTPAPGSEDMKLDGKIVYKRQDVTVDVLLVGSTGKPTITFESDPPMTQQEIMALLLYGKSPNELDSDQQASAGNAQAAFTNGALGLTSLFLFASTPIDSVGYDPATQTYQIRFKLPGGATLSAGSNLHESKTLTLRKRVAKSVELETQMRSTEQQSQRRDAVTTFLQWFKRY